MPVTFTELLPPQTSSKHNSINWSPGRTRGTGLLAVHTMRSTVSYLVIEFGCDGEGRAFHMAKVDEGTDREEVTYDVFCGRNPRDHQCSCKGFAFGRGKPCKHINAIAALLENEGLWNRCELANPEADVSSVELPF